MIIWLLAPLITVLAEYDVTVLGKPEVTVERGSIRLDDLAEVTPERNLDLAASLKNLVIAENIQPGAEVLLNASEVIKRVKDAGFNLEVIGYAFPDNVTIRRRGVNLDTAFAKRLIQEQIEASGEKIEITDLRCDDKTMLPIQFKVQQVSVERALGSSSIAEITVEDSDGVRVSVNCSFKTRTLNPIAVFATTVQKGEVISNSHIVEEFTHGNKGLSVAECVGRVAKSNIASGQICSLSNTERRLVAKKKETVEVVFSSGLLELKMTGVLLDDAVVGETVQVRNPSSGKIISALVKSDGRLYVN